MNLTDVEICSVALVKIGANAIASFEDDSLEADVASRLYEMTLSALLASHPWHFSMSEAQLELIAETAQSGYSQVFALPSDALRIVSAGAGRRSRGLDFRVTGNRLYANADEVTLAYQRRPATTTFPPFFVQAFTAKLAAEFCLPLTEGTSRAESLHALAAAELKIARLVDSQQTTPRAVEDFTLIAARGGS
jgi:hypothetical protein